MAELKRLEDERIANELAEALEKQRQEEVIRKAEEERLAKELAKKKR